MIRSAGNSVVAAGKKRYFSKNGKQNVTNLAKDVMMLQKLLNTEMKYVNTKTGNNITNTAGFVDVLTSAAEGSDSTQRTGRSIKIQRVDVNLEFIYSSGTAATSAEQDCRFSWFVIQYLATPSTSGATAFNIADFLDTDMSGNYTSMSMGDPDTARDFRILANGIVDTQIQSVPAASYAARGYASACIDTNFHQSFNSTTAASIVDNNICIVLTAQRAVNTGGACQYNMNARMWFTDN